MTAPPPEARRALLAEAWHRGDRDTLLVYLMTDGMGLRSAEIVLLRAGDVDARRSMLRVRGMGYPPPGWRPAPAKLVGRAKAYIARHRLDPESWLFPSRNPAEHLSARQAARVLESCAAGAELARKEG